MHIRWIVLSFISLYDFSRDVMRTGLEYEWPSEVFINLDMQDWDEDDED